MLIDGALHYCWRHALAQRRLCGLRRPRLEPYFAGQDVAHILEYFRYNSERLIATTHISGLPDENDAPFLEIAKAAGAILVTGNLKHFPIRKRSGATVESPAEFIQRFES